MFLNRNESGNELVELLAMLVSLILVSSLLFLIVNNL